MLNLSLYWRTVAAFRMNSSDHEKLKPSLHLNQWPSVRLFLGVNSCGRFSIQFMRVIQCFRWKQMVNPCYVRNLNKLLFIKAYKYKQRCIPRQYITYISFSILMKLLTIFHLFWFFIFKISSGELAITTHYKYVLHNIKSVRALFTSFLLLLTTWQKRDSRYCTRPWLLFDNLYISVQRLSLVVTSNFLRILLCMNCLMKVSLSANEHE